VNLKLAGCTHDTEGNTASSHKPWITQLTSSSLHRPTHFWEKRHCSIYIGWPTLLLINWVVVLHPTSTQNRLFRRRTFPKPMEKLKLTQLKHMFTNQKKCTTTQKKRKPGSVASYDMWPGNGEGLVWFRLFINLSLTYLDTYPLNYSPATHTGLQRQYSILTGSEQKTEKINTTRMWANAQHDGRPAEHRWRPLFNAAKFGWRTLLDVVQ